MCRNLTAESNCDPQEVIDEKLKGFSSYYEYYFPAYAYNHYNVTPAEAKVLPSGLRPIQTSSIPTMSFSEAKFPDR
jgi:hypothetical protein